MDRSKQIETIRKRNVELTQRLKDAEFKLEFNSQLNMEGYQRAKDLICELEKIKEDWTMALNDLNDKREKYSNLISDLQEMKKIMISMGFKIPWYKKLFNGLKGL